MTTQLRVSAPIFIAVFLMVWFSSTPAQQKTTRIIKKDGQIIEGKIRGLIAQKSAEEKTKEGKTIYYGKYLLTDGANIATIDEQGVQATVPLAYFSAAGDSALDDAEVINSAMKDFTGNDLVFGLSGKVSLLASGSGLGILFKDRDSFKEMPSWQLIGEVRKEEGKYRVVAAVEIDTDKGLTTIPLSEIVDFKSKSAKPAAEEKTEVKKPL